MPLAIVNLSTAFAWLKYDVIDYEWYKSDLETISQFLKKNLGNLPKQHLISNHEIKIEKDVAVVRSLCHNPLELAQDSNEVALWGIWYHDSLSRTKQGWRIEERVTKVSYHWNLLKVGSKSMG